MTTPNIVEGFDGLLDPARRGRKVPVVAPRDATTTPTPDPVLEKLKAMADRSRQGATRVHAALDAGPSVGLTDADTLTADQSEAMQHRGQSLFDAVNVDERAEANRRALAAYLLNRNRP